MFYECSCGGSGGAILIDDNHIFSGATKINCETNRDSYFAANNDELVDGVQCVLEPADTGIPILQEYRIDTWVDISAVIRGPKGDQGAKGEKGEGIPTEGLIDGETIRYNSDSDSFEGTGDISTDDSLDIHDKTLIAGLGTIQWGGSKATSAGGENLYTKNLIDGDIFSPVWHKVGEEYPTTRIPRIFRDDLIIQPNDDDDLVNPKFEFHPATNDIIIGLKINPVESLTNVIISVNTDGVDFWRKNIGEILEGEFFIDFTIGERVPIDVFENIPYEISIFSADGDVKLKGDSNNGIPWFSLTYYEFEDVYLIPINIDGHRAEHIKPGTNLSSRWDESTKTITLDVVGGDGDGNVNGPDSSEPNEIASFDGPTGKILTGESDVSVIDGILERITSDSRLWIRAKGEKDKITIGDSDISDISENANIYFTDKETIAIALATLANNSQYIEFIKQGVSQGAIGSKGSRNSIGLFRGENSTDNEHRFELLQNGSFIARNDNNNLFFSIQGDNPSYELLDSSGSFVGSFGLEGGELVITMSDTSKIMMSEEGSEILGKLSIGELIPSEDYCLSLSGGAFKPPKLTSIERDNLNVDDGALIDNTTTGQIEEYRNGSWKSFGNGGEGSGVDIDGNETENIISGDGIESDYNSSTKTTTLNVTASGSGNVIGDEFSHNHELASFTGDSGKQIQSRSDISALDGILQRIAVDADLYLLTNGDGVIYIGSTDGSEGLTVNEEGDVDIKGLLLSSSSITSETDLNINLDVGATNLNLNSLEEAIINLRAKQDKDSAITFYSGATETGTIGYNHNSKQLRLSSESWDDPFSDRGIRIDIPGNQTAIERLKIWKDGYHAVIEPIGGDLKLLTKGNDEVVINSALRVLSDKRIYTSQPEIEDGKRKPSVSISGYFQVSAFNDNQLAEALSVGLQDMGKVSYSFADKALVYADENGWHRVQEKTPEGYEVIIDFGQVTIPAGSTVNNSAVVDYTRSGASVPNLQLYKRGGTDQSHNPSYWDKETGTFTLPDDAPDGYYFVSLRAEGDPLRLFPAEYTMFNYFLSLDGGGFGEPDIVDLWMMPFEHGKSVSAMVHLKGGQTLQGRFAAYWPSGHGDWELEKVTLHLNYIRPRT